MRSAEPSKGRRGEGVCTVFKVLFCSTSGRGQVPWRIEPTALLQTALRGLPVRFRPASADPQDFWSRDPLRDGEEMRFTWIHFCCYQGCHVAIASVFP